VDFPALYAFTVDQHLAIQISAQTIGTAVSGMQDAKVVGVAFRVTAAMSPKGPPPPDMIPTPVDKTVFFQISAMGITMNYPDRAITYAKLQNPAQRSSLV